MSVKCDGVTAVDLKREKEERRQSKTMHPTTPNPTHRKPPHSHAEFFKLTSRSLFSRSSDVSRMRRTRSRVRPGCPSMVATHLTSRCSTSPHSLRSSVNTVSCVRLCRAYASTISVPKSICDRWLVGDSCVFGGRKRCGVRGGAHPTEVMCVRTTRHYAPNPPT